MSEPLKNFTSLPDDQEQTFVVFEKKSRDALKKSRTVGLAVGIGIFVVMVGIAMTMGKRSMNAMDKARDTGAEKAENVAAPTPATTPEKAPAKSE